tara:strand:- start:750 stop:2486 length:1737 start_codon:yes stop_codon:yes gene_type:complete
MHYNMIKRGSRPYLEEMANRAHEMPEVYQCINTLQQTPFMVNTPVYQVLKTIHDKGLAVAGLPSGKIELPPKPFDIATNEEARREYSRKALAVHNYNSTIDSKALLTEKIFTVADTYEQFDEFYFPLQYDWRGRIYCVPEGLNYQQNDLAKGLLLFRRGKALGTEASMHKLMVHGANMFGHDKDTLVNRIKWVEDNEKFICQSAEDPHNNYEFWADASEPVQFLAFCFEWNNFVKSGKKLTFITNLICYSDCTNSGLQIFSALLKDEVGGRAVNLIPSNKVQDVYGEVAKATHELLEKEPDSQLKDLWLKYGIDRKTTKKVTMCIVYGLTQFSCRKYIQEHLEEMEEDGIKDIPFSTDRNPIPGLPNIFKGTAYLSKLVWKALDKVIVSAKEAMKWLQQVSKLVSENGLPVVWTTPTGFVVQMVCPVLETKRINTYMGEKIFRPKSGNYTPDIRKTSIAIETNKIDKRRVANSIAPCFVHALDGAILQKAVCKANDAGIESFACVHDSFGVLACDVNDMNVAVREAFVDIFDNKNLLEEFKQEIIPQVHKDSRSKIKEAPAQGTLELKQVLGSWYFCS